MKLEVIRKENGMYDVIITNGGNVNIISCDDLADVIEYLEDNNL